jgi:hypothetical protein
MIYVINAPLRDLPPETFEGVDSLIMDPPYSAHVHTAATSAGNFGRDGHVNNRDLGFESLDPADREHALRLAHKYVKRWTVVFSDFAKGEPEGENDGDDYETRARAGHFVIEGDCAWRVMGVHFRLDYVRLIPWVRWSQPQVTGDRPPSGAEAVLHFHKRGKKSWNGPGGLTHYAHKSLRGADKHPTEKPLDLMLDLVSYYSNPGELVGDFFAGRGTTGQAARILGRDAILVERDATFAAQAEARTSTPLDDRDLGKVETWIVSTVAQAEAEIASPQTTPNGIRRAESRLTDAACAAAFLEGA